MQNIYKKTGSTPGRYVESIRLSRARELLESGDMSMGLIAEACGFLREERLRRAFVRRFEITPSQYRIHFKSYILATKESLHGR